MLLRSFCLGLAVLLLGFCTAKFRTEIVAAPVLMHRLGPVEVDGRVESAQLHGKGIRAVVAPSSIEGLGEGELPRRVRISVRRGGERLLPGAIVRFGAAVLMPPPPPSEPGDYDFGRAAYFEQIGAVGYAFGAPETLAPAPSPALLQRLALSLQALRFRMSGRIHAVLPGSTGAVAAALVTGDRGGISQDDEQALRDAGLAHVLAIAGLHMALVGLGLFWTVRALLALWPRVALTQPIKKWAALSAIGGAAFYLAISGSATPATRAFTMLAMMLLAILFDRPALSMRSLAFAAIAPSRAGAGDADRARISDVVCRCRKSDRRCRMGTAPLRFARSAAPAAICACPTLYARHSNNQFRGQHRDDALCSVSFRSGHTLRGPR